MVVLVFVDNLLRHLFLHQVPGLTSEMQVRFQPPDEAWRKYVAGVAVGGSPAMSLNVYLVEMCENRKLRSNERVREVDHGLVTETPAPRRVDCHYLITAWSPATDSLAVEPTVDEHALLYDVTAALMHRASLVPREIYVPAPLPAGFPDLIADAELPTTVLPVEGFPKYAEFWGTMGNIHPWKPAVYLVVTVPIALTREVAGPMVTTRITEYRHAGSPDTADVWIQIGGQVLDMATPLPDGSPRPVGRTWVHLESVAAGGSVQTVETDAQGRFTFGGLRAGSYRLRTQALGLGEKTREVSVPTETVEYDLRFP